MKKYILILLAPLFIIATAYSWSVVVGPGANINSAEAPAGNWFGSTAQSRANAGVDGFTIISGTISPYTGNVTSIKIYVDGAVTGAQFASFIDETNDTFSTNGTTSGVNLVSGLNTLVAPTDFTAFAITNVQYAGVYIPSGGGSIVYDDTGGDGWWYVAGDSIPASSVEFGTAASIAISLEFYVQ